MYIVILSKQKTLIMIKPILSILYTLLLLSTTTTFATIVQQNNNTQNNNTLINECVDLGVFMAINVKDHAMNIPSEEGIKAALEDIKAVLKAAGSNLAELDKCASLGPDAISEMRGLVDEKVKTGKYDNLLMKKENPASILLQVDVATCVDIFMKADKSSLSLSDVPTEEEAVKLKVDLGYEVNVILACNVMEANQTIEFMDLVNNLMTK